MPGYLWYWWRGIEKPWNPEEIHEEYQPASYAYEETGAYTEKPWAHPLALLQQPQTCSHEECGAEEEESAGEDILQSKLVDEEVLTEPGQHDDTGKSNGNYSHPAESLHIRWGGLWGHSRIGGCGSG